MKQSSALLIVLLILGIDTGRFLMPQYRAVLGWKPVGMELLILALICQQLRQSVKQERLRRGFTVAAWGLIAGSLAATHLL